MTLGGAGGARGRTAGAAPAGGPPPTPWGVASAIAELDEEIGGEIGLYRSMMDAVEGEVRRAWASTADRLASSPPSRSGGRGLPAYVHAALFGHAFEVACALMEREG